MAPQTISMAQAQQLIERGSATVEVGPSTHQRSWNRLHTSYRGEPVTYIVRGASETWHLDNDAAELAGILEAEYRDEMDTIRSLREGLHW